VCNALKAEVQAIAHYEQALQLANEFELENITQSTSNTDILDLFVDEKLLKNEI